MLDMGDFVGGLLKYFKRYPLPKLIIGGGFAKFTKLAQENLDLHSGRSRVDFEILAKWIKVLGATNYLYEKAKSANTANEVLKMADSEELPIADFIAQKAGEFVRKVLRNTKTDLTILIVSRISGSETEGDLIGKHHVK